MTRASDGDGLEEFVPSSARHAPEAVTAPLAGTRSKRNFAEYAGSAYSRIGPIAGDDDEKATQDGSSQDSTASDTALQIRRAAFEAATGNMAMGEHVPIGLLSATDNHTRPDTELGVNGFDI